MKDSVIIANLNTSSFSLLVELIFLSGLPNGTDLVKVGLKGEEGEGCIASKDRFQQF